MFCVTLFQNNFQTSRQGHSVHLSGDGAAGGGGDGLQDLVGSSAMGFYGCRIVTGSNHHHPRHRTRLWWRRDHPDLRAKKKKPIKATLTD
jgi:hypothetical protein